MVRTVESHDPPRVTFTPPAPAIHYFEYVGSTGMTAVGPVTRRRYRFTSHGAIVAVDERDAPSMAGVPNVRRAKSPK